MQIQYKTADLSKMKITAPENKRNIGQYQISTTFNDGTESTFKTSRRFWSSFNRKYAITENIFNHFTPDEVFQRIASGPMGKEAFRLTLETTGNETEALGISALNKTVITSDMVSELISEYEGSNSFYRNGVQSVTFAPRLNGAKLLKIGGDDFNQRFVIDFPLDGVGSPTAMLALLRLVCQNGLVALSPLFQSDIIIEGSTPMLNLSRAVQSYNNEEGWHQISERLISAQNSFASLREVNKAEEVLVKMGAPVEVQRSLRDVFGTVEDRYQIASANEISKKLQAQLPMSATVYDLFNFMTEVTTHSTIATIQTRRDMAHAMVGDMLSETYDLEGTARKSKDFADVFLKKEAVAA